MNRNFFVSSIIGISVGLLNGLFGAGGGSVAILCLEKFMKIKAHKAHATTLAIVLPLSIVSMFIYLRGVEIEPKYIIVISLGGIIGGYVGAKFLRKIPIGWLRKIFGVFMLVGAWRILL